MPLLLALVVLAGFACAPPAGDASREPVYAFVGVNVVPMDEERVLPDQTVLVQGDRIVQVGADVLVPDGAIRIDGTGKYLIPGLAEMHAHVPPGDNVADSTIERVLALYALHGVTTIRGMLGHPRHLAFRERARRGELLSPLIYTTGPSLNGNSVPTPEAAVAAVTAQKVAGYDLMKIHPGIGRVTFDSLAATAKRVGIRFAGHVPLDVGLERAIEAGYWSVDHIDGFVEALVAHTGSFTPEEDGFFGLRLIDRVDERRIPALAAKLKAGGVWVVPTETLMEYVIGDYPVEELRARPEMRYMTEAQLDRWAEQTAGMRGAGATMAQREKYIALRRSIIEQLHAAGVGLLLGSDAPQVWNVPGYSAHRELAMLVAAGLTPYQALETGTRNVSVYFGTENETGTIAVGKRADLLLLEGNPLDEIGSVDRQAGIMLGGRWLPADEIARRLDSLAVQ